MMCFNYALCYYFPLEFYLKMTVFILENKYKVYKTAPVRASPDVNFREKFTLPLTSPQLKDSTLTFNLYMKTSSKKRLGAKIRTGKTIIGPYMKHGDRSLSQWEKMITTPMEEISELHILYLWNIVDNFSTFLQVDVPINVCLVPRYIR